MNTLYSKPAQSFGRSFYETGRSAATDNAGGNLIPSASAFEKISGILGTPGFLVSLEVAINSAAPAGNLYLLAYDLAVTSNNVNAVAGGTAGAARYTFGPLTAGGTFAREWAEVFPPFAEGLEPLITGAPFDNGCILAASLTPVTYTAPGANPIYHALARIAQGGC